MTELLDLAAALNTLYKYIDWHITEKDFIDLSEEDYKKLPSCEHGKTWYLINPFRLKYRTKTKLIVDASEMKQLLSATRLIRAISQQMPEEVSFRDRLLYCKHFLPSCIFSDKDKGKR